jgi:hypothetical protein
MKMEASSNPYKTSDELDDDNDIFDNPTTAKCGTQKAPAWLFSDQARQALRRGTTALEEHAIVSIDGNHMTSIKGITALWIRGPAAPLRFAPGWDLPNF